MKGHNNWEESADLSGASISLTEVIVSVQKNGSHPNREYFLCVTSATSRRHLLVGHLDLHFSHDLHLGLDIGPAPISPASFLTFVAVVPLALNLKGFTSVPTPLFWASLSIRSIREMLGPRKGNNVPNYLNHLKPSQTYEVVSECVMAIHQQDILFEPISGMVSECLL